MVTTTPLANLLPGKSHGKRCGRGWVGPGCTENFRVRTPDRLARRELLNRLRYPEPPKRCYVAFRDVRVDFQFRRVNRPTALSRMTTEDSSK